MPIHDWNTLEPAPSFSAEGQKLRDWSSSFNREWRWTWIVTRFGESMVWRTCQNLFLQLLTELPVPWCNMFSVWILGPTIHHIAVGPSWLRIVLHSPQGTSEGNYICHWFNDALKQFVAFDQLTSVRIGDQSVFAVGRRQRSENPLYQSFYHSGRDEQVI
jgi:hypothetical protein